MSTPERLGDRVLDLVVYAPLGLALEAKELIPKLADRGRGQVALARLAGKVASQQSPAGITRLLDELRDAVISAVGLSEPTPRADQPGEAIEDPEIELPIEGYQSIAAAELLELLEPLSDDDLSDLLAFEQDHRARATVINRIRQLRS